MRETMRLEELITKAKRLRASDIHLVCRCQPAYRVDGKLIHSPDDEVLTPQACEAFAKELVMGARVGADESEEVDIREKDLSLSVGGIRIRANVFRQQGEISAALRILPSEIPELAALGLPPVVYEFPTWKSGIVLVTGETGSGKSTTLAAILNEINRSRQGHIITLEDPIEYIYKPDKCVINQRQVGVDTESFSQGLRASLREDPDIILIGEMRDGETIETALTAAETGHLVFATLHTNSATDTIERIVGRFPSGQQPQIRTELSLCLRAVMAQKLIPKKGGGRVAACEVMVVTPAIRNLIREGKTAQIYSSILTDSKVGSMALDTTLLALLRADKVEMKDVEELARDPEYLRKNLRGTAGRW